MVPFFWCRFEPAFCKIPPLNLPYLHSSSVPKSTFDVIHMAELQMDYGKVQDEPCVTHMLLYARAIVDSSEIYFPLKRRQYDSAFLLFSFRGLNIICR